jgi:uncharacterized protein with PIN domain
MEIKLADKQRTVSKMLEILGYQKMALDAKNETRIEVLKKYAGIILERARGEQREKAERLFGYLQLA